MLRNALFTLTAVGLPGSAALATTVVDVPVNTQFLITQDRTSVAGTGDNVFTSSGQNPPFVGQRFEQNGNNNIDRPIFVFDLPDAPTGETLVSATLSVAYVRDLVDPSEPSVAVFHSSSVNAYPALTADQIALYDDASFTDTGELIFTPSSTVNEDSPLSVDVSAEVLADYAADSPGDLASAFRLQLDSPVGSTAQARYGFEGTVQQGSVANLPTLTLTFEVIPEPASLSLLGIGTLLIARRRRRA